jgi:hypothetical protein
LKEIKESHNSTRIVIHTNASGKSTAWWEEFTSLLNENDVVFFSIDGTPTNYIKYRINSKWEDVENAVKTCVATSARLNTKTKFIWKHLVFSYNENTIMESYKKSKELGISFNLQESMVPDDTVKTETGGGSWLKPTRPFSEIEAEFNEQKSNPLL